VNYSKTTHINKKIMTNRLAKPVLSSLIFASLTGAAIEVGAYEAGDIILRVGPTLVQPDDSSGDLFADNLGNLTSALGTKTGVGVDSNTQAGITATYMMSDKWGIELLAATPFEHDISAKGTGALGVTSVGDTKHLPPTLSMLYFSAASSSPSSHSLESALTTPYSLMNLPVATSKACLVTVPSRWMIPGEFPAVSVSTTTSATTGALRLQRGGLILIPKAW